MGKIRRAIADFIRSRRVDDKRHPRFVAGYAAGLNDAKLERQCHHIWGAKRDPAFGFPVDGSIAVCIRCGETASEPRVSNDG